MEKSTLIMSGFKIKGRNFYREIGDTFQLINFQSSNYSNDNYINVAIWPAIMGSPGALQEYKFPIRGRIEDFVSSQAGQYPSLRELIVTLSGPLSTFDGIREAWKDGKLKNIYLSADARAVFNS